MLVDYGHTPFRSQEWQRKGRVNTDVELIEKLKRKVTSTEKHNNSDETHADKLFLLSKLSDVKKERTERKLKLWGDII